MSSNFLKICLKFSLVSISLLLLQSAQSQTDWSDVDQFLQSKQKELGKNFVVAIWKKDDTVVYKKEIGQFNSKTQAPVSQISQLFTTALVLAMVDEGKVTMDDKASTYIPEFARYGKNYVSLRTCLSHMTGISEKGKFMSKVFQRLPSTSLEEEVNQYARKEIRANPTQDFWYGNIGINIAGRVLEVVNKKRFDVLAKLKLFTPLTMRRTVFTTLDGSPVDPSSSASTTVDDYMKFIAMLLNNGSYGGKQILSEESMDLLKTVVARKDIMKFSPDVMKPFDYASGAWVLEEKDNKATAIACPGWYGAYTVIDWKKGYGFIVLPKEPVDDEKTQLYLQLTEMIGEKF